MFSSRFLSIVNASHRFKESRRHSLLSQARRYCCRWRGPRPRNHAFQELLKELCLHKLCRQELCLHWGPQAAIRKHWQLLLYVFVCIPQLLYSQLGCAQLQGQQFEQLLLQQQWCAISWTNPPVVIQESTKTMCPRPIMPVGRFESYRCNEIRFVSKSP